jgi:hypothetical protein
MISDAEEVWQTWVSEGNECSWEQMDEGSRNEDTCAEMLRYKY